MKNGAFSLIEILIVISFIGIITAVSATTYTQFSKQSRDGKRQADLQQVQQALELYKSNETGGAYPTPCLSSATCNAGLPFGTGSLTGANNNVYYQSLPQDTKGGHYNYTSTSPYQTYVLYATLENNSTFALNPYGKTSLTPTVIVVVPTNTPPTPPVPTIPPYTVCVNPQVIDSETPLILGSVCIGESS